MFHLKGSDVLRKRSERMSAPLKSIKRKCASSKLLTHFCMRSRALYYLRLNAVAPLCGMSPLLRIGISGTEFHQIGL